VNNFQRNSIIAFLISIALIVASPVLADTQLDIDYETPSFKDKKLVSNLVEVSVSYNKQENPDSDSDNLHYQIFYNGVPQINSSNFTTTIGSVALQDLDGNGVSEVIIKTFSGGAHCCTNLNIYTWNNKKFVKAETGFLDGEGGNFQDLNGDEKLEFITYDNSFLYRFSSYASSFPPSRIYAFRNGRFENVTRKYIKHLKSRAWEMYQTFLQVKKEGNDVNGILAGYVAQKALLGEFQQAWEFMLANYDRTSDWGLSRYKGDREVGKYANFPTALKAFLIEQGYLSRDAKNY
jgi:hypothetical protein